MSEQITSRLTALKKAIGTIKPKRDDKGEPLLVIANIWSDSDCKWSEGEYTKEILAPHSFDVEFIEDFDFAVDEWVDQREDDLLNECTYQLLLQQYYEHDGAGALIGRGFDVVESSANPWEE